MSRAVSLTVAVLLLAGCSEKPQLGASSDRAPAWLGAQDPYVVPGWKPGDKASWEQQLQARAQAQNEYRRIGTSH